MRKILTAVIASTLLLAGLTTPVQAATPKAGAACAKAGITQAASQLGFNKYTDARNWMLDRTKHPGTVKLKLSEVTENNGQMDPYGIGAIATEFLVANVGMAKFVGIYTQIGTGKTFEQAFKASTGVSLADFYLMFEDSRSVLGAPRG